MKIEPVGLLSTHNVEGPFKLQFHKTREEIYTDTCLRIDAVYTEAQILQLVEACAAAVEPELVDPEDQDEAFQSKKASAARIRNMIKEMLPAAELAKQEKV